MIYISSSTLVILLAIIVHKSWYYNPYSKYDNALIASDVSSSHFVAVSNGHYYVFVDGTWIDINDELGIATSEVASEICCRSVGDDILFYYYCRKKRSIIIKSLSGIRQIVNCIAIEDHLADNTVNVHLSVSQTGAECIVASGVHTILITHSGNRTSVVKHNAKFLSQSGVSSVSLSQHGHYAIIMFGNTVSLYDVSSGNCIAERYLVKRACFIGPNLLSLQYIGSGTIEVYTLKDANIEECRELRFNPGLVHGLGVNTVYIVDNKWDSRINYILNLFVRTKDVVRVSVYLYKEGVVVYYCYVCTHNVWWSEYNTKELIMSTLGYIHIYDNGSIVTWNVLQSKPYVCYNATSMLYLMSAFIILTPCCHRYMRMKK